jgi:micrococcal nuclease
MADRTKIMLRRGCFSGPIVAVLTVLALFISISLPQAVESASAPAGRTIEVARVIDGDTIVTTDSEHIRYIGIDAPETGEPFSFKATEVNRALLRAGPVKIVECRGEKLDRYGRTLAWVYAGGRLVNGELLRRGLARPLFIPPCGLEKKPLLERLAWQARNQGRGIWEGTANATKAPEISPEDASGFIDTIVTVRGRVQRVRESPRVLIMEFGSSESNRSSKPVFRAVIFPPTLRYFLQAGLEPARLSGREVSVTGRPRIFMGTPEIILVDPGQVRVY